MSFPPPPLVIPRSTFNITVPSYRIVNKPDIPAVNVQLAIVIPAFGWTSFSLTTPLGGLSHSRGREENTLEMGQEI